MTMMMGCLQPNHQSAAKTKRNLKRNQRRRARSTCTISSLTMQPMRSQTSSIQKERWVPRSTQRSRWLGDTKVSTNRNSLRWRRRPGPKRRGLRGVSKASRCRWIRNWMRSLRTIWKSKRTRSRMRGICSHCRARRTQGSSRFR